MDEIKRYHTVRESNFQDLDNLVNQLIKKGWQPFGNPYVTDSEREFLACQAMVLCSEDEILSIEPEISAATENNALSEQSLHEAYNEMIKGLAKG